MTLSAERSFFREVTFLLLNQTFHPDVVATSQYLSEVAVRLVQRGHKVTVITSRRGYAHPEQLFPSRETWRGVRIYRVWSTGFGKDAKWRRAADFASFLVFCGLRVLFTRRHDAVVALTSPPLISFLGAIIAALRGSRFYYWVMDLNPDEAVAAGWLPPNSLVARTLEWMSRFSLRRADRIMALDRFMKDRILAKGVAPENRVTVVSLWSQDDRVAFDAVGREQFRKRHGLDGKFVVMYSGNHSPCHRLDTLLQAAELLREQSHLVFCFVGGGSEWRKIQEAIELQRHPSMLCLAYQPMSQLSESLSAADLHVALMGDEFVGLVHPCKIYNILSVRAPILYVGPELSHISEILGQLEPQYLAGSFRHGDAAAVAQFISGACTFGFHRQDSQGIGQFSNEVIVAKLISILEGREGTPRHLGRTGACKELVH